MQSFLDTRKGILVHAIRIKITWLVLVYNSLLNYGLLLLPLFMLSCYACMWMLERLNPYFLREPRKLHKDMKYSLSFTKTVSYTWILIFPSFEVDICIQRALPRGVTVFFFLFTYFEDPIVTLLTFLEKDKMKYIFFISVMIILSLWLHIIY